MRTKTDMQSKIKHYMGKPRKFLSKARDSYVKSMENCANKIGHGGVVSCPAAQVSSLPRSFSVNYSKSRNEERLVAEILAAVSKKMGSEMDLKVRHDELGQQKMDSCAMRRSYTSVGLGKMGRIDEDKPCYFEDDDMAFARSRSCAAKRSFQF